MSSEKEHRMTYQRHLILQELVKTKTHPSADEIYTNVRQILPRISLGTVYRNLEVLAQLGYIQKIEFAGNQKRFDGNPENHFHIVCIFCQRVDDIPMNVVKKIKISGKKIKNYHNINYYMVFIKNT